MYSIGTIVYGIDFQTLDRTDPWSSLRNNIEEISETFDDIVQMHYSGGGEGPLFFGVEIGSFDVIDTIYASTLIPMLTANYEQKQKYTDLLKSLDDLEEEFPNFVQTVRAFEPAVFITWGTS